jgi:hypothetical protein
VKGSRHKNMKELRPGSSGRSKAIPLADDRFDEHLERMKKET